MVKNRAENVKNWTMDMLLLILLRQFKRLLQERGVTLTETEMQTIAQAAAEHRLASEQITAVRTAIIEIVEESLSVLQGWDLTYAQSLATSMDAMPGWETTADFLELANEKGNAELRISTGSALLAGLGDPRYLAYLRACAKHGADDPEDVDAVIAQKVLDFVG